MKEKSNKKHLIWPVCPSGFKIALTKMIKRKAI